MSKRATQSWPARNRGVPGAGQQIAWYQAGPARLFFLVFALALAAIGGFAVLQGTTWRSTAVVLIAANESAEAAAGVASSFDIALKSRALLQPEVTAALASRLREQGIELHELHKRLQAAPVDDTNVVRLYVEGDQREVLSTVVNSWVETYLDIQARQVEGREAATPPSAGGQLSGRAAELQEARLALENFQQQHDLVSAGREEKSLLAQLDDLQRAYDNAVRDEERARTSLEELEAAVERGERILPRDQELAVKQLENEIGRLEERLAELEERFTREYIMKHPRYREVVDRLAELEVELEESYASGVELNLSESGKAVAAARQAVADLDIQIAEQRQRVAEFSALSSAHDDLVAELARLGERSWEARAGRAEADSGRLDNYPTVSVIQWAPADSDRIGPDYLLVLSGSAGLALLLAAAAVWLRFYLWQRRVASGVSPEAPGSGMPRAEPEPLNPGLSAGPDGPDERERTA